MTGCIHLLDDRASYYTILSNIRQRNFDSLIWDIFSDLDQNDSLGVLSMVRI